MSKIAARKPRLSNRIYPRVEVFDGRIYVQSVRYGVWKRVPIGRAKQVKNRLIRAIKYAEKCRLG